MEKTPGNNSQDLKAAREALGLSLEDIFNQTRVRVVYLQAIENKEFHLLPVPVYSKNFIKVYARALGIDSEPIIQDYENYLNSLKETQTLTPEDVSGKKLLSGRLTGHKTRWVSVFVVIAVMVVSWIIYKQYESSSDIINSTKRMTNAIRQNQEQNVKSSFDAAAPVAEAIKVNPALALNEMNKQLPVGKQTTLANNENDNVKTLKKQVSPPVENMQTVSDREDANLLVIRAIEETWMRVKADQNPSFQILLKPGEKFERKAVKFDIYIGNAGGIKIQFKGKDIEDLGKSGDVVHLRLP
ncbi:MAG TPA: helix-turn-helix domain-containing protein [Smithella sp.]|nr:helix-turn-helix domain-containing protein [Smithella sp.]